MRARSISRIALFAGAFALLACAPSRPAAAPKMAPRARFVGDRPLVTGIAREGDPRSAIAFAVTTEGIADDRGAEVAVALAAVIEARLRGVHDVTVTPAWSGYRVRALVASDAEAAVFVDAARAALTTPIATSDLGVAEKKLAALAHRPLPHASYADVAECTGEPFGSIATRERTAIDPSALEAWRAAAHGASRIAFGVAGDAAIGARVEDAIARGAAWPNGAAFGEESRDRGKLAVYDASGEIAPGSARAVIAVRTSRASPAVAVAGLLGDPTGPLASRLGGLDAPARVRDVTATAHARGGCIAVTLELAARDLASDPAPRVATAVALAQQEIAVELAEADTAKASGDALARRAGDPRDTAERAAWWSLSEIRDREEANEAPRVSTTIGIANARDSAFGPQTTHLTTGASEGNAREAAIRTALDRATVAWHEPVVETRARVERGQGEMWIVLASPCGTLAEGSNDAGLGAAVAIAAANGRGDGGRDIEGWASAEGVGVIVHGAALPGESKTAEAVRLADLAARRFAADAIDPSAITFARSRLLRAADQDDARAFAALAEAIAPGHPSWLEPQGTLDALGRSSDAAALARASAMRAGPLRVAVLADEDDAQAAAAVRAVDRWIPRHAFESRACPAPSGTPLPRAGTYAIDLANGGAPEAWLALPLPPNDDDARANASMLAAALDGEGGLLAHAIAGMARSASAHVVGPRNASALVLRVSSPPSALDAAVAQVRVLLDRLRQGALTQADVDFARVAVDREELARSLDRRARVLDLWRGAPPTTPASPTLDTLRAFASQALHDDALIIVVARQARAPHAP